MHTLLPGRFIERPHRFGAYVDIQGEVRYVHVAASGRMRELLFPGNRVLVQDRPAGKTRGRLAFAWHNGGWVSTDAQLPGRVARALLLDRRLPPFAGYTQVRPEYTYGESRLDFRLDGGPPGTPPCLIEVKSVTLVVDGEARFPDAPTARGARHLAELARARAEGYRAAVLFIIQREDGLVLVPNAPQDPDFCQALQDAAAAGVEIHAYRARVVPPDLDVITGAPVPVRL